MRTRETYYRDYGVADEDKRKVLDFCLSARNDEQMEILRCAIRVNPGLAQDIFYALTKGVRYDKLSRIQDIPAQDKDFAGYLRKTVWEIYDYMRLVGKIK